jgi:hypothetical protein
MSTRLTAIPPSNGSPVTLDHIDVSHCSPSEWYDVARATFTTKVKALYWMHSSAGVPVSTNASISLLLTKLNQSLPTGVIVAVYSI